MEGMDKHLALCWRAAVSLPWKILAEQAVEDLLDIEGYEEERAGELIMTARAPWFAEAEQTRSVVKA